MEGKRRSPLVQSAESLTASEMFMAPELPTLVALDACLLAAIRLLEFQHPFFPERGDDRYLADSVEEHIADSICVLAIALRKSLSAYYAAIRENEHQWDDQEDVSF